MAAQTRSVDEQAQAAALTRYHLFDGPPEPDLQTVVEFAARLCGVPMAVLHVLDAEHQFQVAAVGIETGVCRREDSMCSVAVVEPLPVFVEDASRDRRFADNPFVTGVLQRFRFYAASQLHTPDGFVLGTLCVFDNVPRVLDDQQRHGLDQLARMAIDVLELRRHGFLVAELLREQQCARQALERANQALGHFATQLAHDLRSPLTGVLAFSAELRSLPAVSRDADACDCADRVAASARRMGELIDEVLARATDPHAEHVTEVDLREVAGRVLDDLAVQIADAGADVDLAALPSVSGDATQWRILLQNLIGNAVKYRHPGRRCRVTVSAHCDDEWYRVCVVDNGIGIPAAHRDRVTRPFTRLAPDRGDGFGIGLSTCARIVHAHAGRLDISDTPGGGTTVCVVLPTGR